MELTKDGYRYEAELQAALVIRVEGVLMHQNKKIFVSLIV